MSLFEQAADKRSVAQPAERMLEVDHLEEGPLAVAIMAVGQVQEQSRVSHMGVLTQDHQGLADSMRENPLFSSGVHRCICSLHPESHKWFSKGLPCS